MERGVGQRGQGEIIKACDFEDVLRVSQIMWLDGLDVCGAGKERNVRVKEGFKILPEHLEPWNFLQLGRKDCKWRIFGS